MATVSVFSSDHLGNIARYSSPQDLCSLACLNKTFHFGWDEYVATNSQLISKYVQSVLENEDDPNKIPTHFLRFASLVYDTALTLTIPYSKFKFTALEGVAKKFPNLQHLSYPLPISTSISQVAKELLIEGAPAFAPAVAQLSLELLPTHPVSMVPFFTIIMVGFLLGNIVHFKRSLYLKSISSLFPMIQTLQIDLAKSSPSMAKGTLSELPCLTQLKKITLCDKSEDKFIARRIQEILPFAGKCTMLKHLKFDQTSFSEKDFRTLITKLPTKLEKLTFVKLCRSSTPGTNALSALFLQCPALVSLNLKESPGLFDDPPITASTSIRKLTIDDNRTEESYAHLFATVPQLSDLKIRSALFFNYQLPNSTELKNLTLVQRMPSHWSPDSFLHQITIEKLLPKYPNLERITFISNDGRKCELRR